MKTEVLISYTLYILGIAVLLALGIAVFVLVVKLKKANSRAQQFENRHNELELRVNGLQLQTLESKLNPHLFKNILNSIQSHAYQTYHALDKMANVLDYILYESQQKFVSPKEEMEFAMNLIEINKIKISPLFDLKVKSKINENEPLFEQAILAPMISIDMIENAFKHADLKSPDAFISIVFEFKNDTFILTVSNKISNQKKLQKPNSGIGANTLQQRLDIIYGTSHKLEKFIENDVFVAHLKINLLEYKTQMLAAGR